MYNEFIKKIRKLEKLGKNDSTIVKGEELSKICFIIENFIPAIDLLEKRLENGCEIVRQDKKWYLFDDEGEPITNGETLRDILINLIFLDC